jgi:hypothetical protein
MHGMRGPEPSDRERDHYEWRVQDGFDLEGFLGQPLVARVATVGRVGPTVRPVWYLWDKQAFWWLTGGWSNLAQLVERDPRVALVVDTCDLERGEVLQVTARGAAVVQPFGAGRAPLPGVRRAPPAPLSGWRLRRPHYEIRRVGADDASSPRPLVLRSPAKGRKTPSSAGILNGNVQASRQPLTRQDAW